MLKVTLRDILFCICALFLTGCFCLFLYLGIFQDTGSTVIVTHSGEVLHQLPLNTDSTTTVSEGGHQLTLQIQNGYAKVIASDCEGQDCVNAPAIHREGQVILCAPQEILIRITSADAPDAVVK